RCSLEVARKRQPDQHRSRGRERLASAPHAAGSCAGARPLGRGDRAQADARSDGNGDGLTIMPSVKITLVKGLVGTTERQRTTVPVWFEGGQMPLQRRIPKLGGFSNARFKVTYLPVNVESLNSFGSGATVTPESLRTAGLVRKSRGQVKILGRGDVTVALNVKAHAFSETAKAKITAAGGTVEVL